MSTEVYPVKCMNCETPMKEIGRTTDAKGKLIRMCHLCPNCLRRVEFMHGWTVVGLNHCAEVVAVDGEYFEVQLFRFPDKFEGWIPDGGVSEQFTSIDEAMKAVYSIEEDERHLNGGW